MRMLAIDVGTRYLGWAVGSPGCPPEWGTHLFDKVGARIGTLMLEVDAWLIPNYLHNWRSTGLTHILYEAPVLVHSNDFLTIRKVNCVGGHIEYLAGAYQFPHCEEQLPNVVARHFLGSGNVPRKSDPKKEAMIARCGQLGWHAKTTHEADALGLLDYGLALKGSRLAQLGLLG